MEYAKMMEILPKTYIRTFTIESLFTTRYEQCVLSSILNSSINSIRLNMCLLLLFVFSIERKNKKSAQKWQVYPLNFYAVQHIESMNTELMRVTVAVAATAANSNSSSSSSTRK